MLCDINNCTLGQPEERGERFTFGYLCKAHYALLDDFLASKKDLKLDMKSKHVQRRLWVSFKMKQEQNAIGSSATDTKPKI